MRRPADRRRFTQLLGMTLARRFMPPLSLTAFAKVMAADPEVKRTLYVGKSRDLKTLRQASEVARDGDQVLVEPGDYRGDVAVWRQKGLVIRAEKGVATLVAEGASAEDKGIFVFRGADALVENLSFVGARSRDRNGAGIRLDVDSRLTVRRCRFHDNENGILTANDSPSELHLIDSEFVNNGAGDGQSHNLYVGTIGRLTVSGCYFARARVGHLLKTRARESIVSYSRLTGEDGTSSYELEFPSGGRAVVVGCLIQQGPKSENSTIMSYGAEGYRWEQNELFVAFSTIVNDRTRGATFLRAAAGASRVEMTNNLLVGSGDFDVRASVSNLKNVDAKPADFVNPGGFDYRLRRSSRHIGAAGIAGSFTADRVRPDREYVHPASSVSLEPMSGLTPLCPGAFQRVAP